MADLRTVLAAVLGVGLGLVLLAFPGTIIRMQTVGRLPHDRDGGYGQAAAPPRRWLLVVRGIGIGLVIAGGYFGWTVIGAAGPV